jgi:hypothetical protein
MFAQLACIVYVMSSPLQPFTSIIWLVTGLKAAELIEYGEAMPISAISAVTAVGLHQGRRAIHFTH